MNKIKKTSAVISLATFVLNVFFDVKFVITKKDAIFCNSKWNVSVKYNFTWNVSMLFDCVM